MGLPAKLLGADERIVFDLRTHGKALVGPALLLVLTAVVVGVGLAVAPTSWQPWASWVIGVLAALAFVGWVLFPFLRWLTTTYTFTDRRVITRKGIVNKSGHDLPLSRINNVSYERSLLDRILGCGTLILTTAAEAPLTLHDIPDVERVHVAMTELLFASDENQPGPEHDA